MKKFVVALVLATVALSGCGLFRSSKSWEKAKQENPLEIPPGMDRPSVSEALVIPSVNAPKQAASAASANATSLHLDDDVDSAYRRVGLALERGDLGTVSAQDESAHSYQVTMSAQQGIESNKGFFERHFSNTQNAPDQPGAGAAPTNASKGPVVNVRVEPAAAGGSTVSVQGDAEQAARLAAALKARLGA